MKALRLVFILIGTHCPEETRFRRGFSLSHGAGRSAALERNPAGPRKQEWR